MARFHVVPRCPLPVQFWLFGLDARCGDLQRRGFARQATTFGSSAYTLGALTLHSAGLQLDLDAGPLHFTRQTRTFTLGGMFLPAAQGLTLCSPALAAHEAWMADTHGITHRTRQLQTHRLPPPVRRNMAVWQTHFGQPDPVGRDTMIIQALHSVARLRGVDSIPGSPLPTTPAGSRRPRPPA